MLVKCTAIPVESFLVKGKWAKYILMNAQKVLWEVLRMVELRYGVLTFYFHHTASLGLITNQT